MDKKTKKKTGGRQRLIALLLCCVFLLTVAPISAIALDENLPDENLTEQTSVGDTPVGETPVSETPVSETPVSETPVSETPVSETPANETPENQTTTVDLVQDLFNRLMACETYDALDAMEQGLTDAENALVDEFTEEQEAALEAKRAELLGEEDEEDEETASSEESNTWSLRSTDGASTWASHTYTIEQGGSQFVSASNVWNLSSSCNPSASITVSGTRGGYNINVGSSVPVDTYTLTVTYGYGQYKTTDTITVKVKAPDTSAYTFTVTPILNNVEVAYFAYHTEADTQNVELIQATNGSDVVIENFSYNQDGYIVFFVKPNDNYLLTNATGTGNNDVYDINLVTTTGNIRSYPGLEKIVEVAKGAGYEYIGVLGYSRKSGDTGNMNQTITLSAKSPDIEVTAVSSKNTGVKPGDTLTFTVTITPGTIAGSAATVSGVEITSLTINDVNVQYSELVDNGNGTYTTTVTYTATQADCDAGSVKLDVTANVSYQNLLGVTDNQTLASQATITKSASVECSIAPKDRVVYRLTYVAVGIDESTYPDVIKTKPNDVTDVYEGQEVDVENNFYAQTTVDDPVNRGTWTFDGWSQDGEKVGDKVTMGKETIYLDGIWTFEPYPNADLIIKKTISGNMYNANDKFTFTVTIDGETLSTFDLGDEETRTLSIPIGATVIVTEDPDGYTYSIDSKNTTITGYTAVENGYGITFTMPTEGGTVVFNNDKTVTIDTGISLDSLPYMVILGVTALGAVLLLNKRRYRSGN